MVSGSLVALSYKYPTKWRVEQAMAMQEEEEAKRRESEAAATDPLIND